MRALILADDCNPEWPSLPVVGYKAAKAIADKIDVTVATHIRNRANIEKAGFGKARVVYIDNEYVARPLYALSKLIRGGTNVGWTVGVAMSYPSYLAFEWEVWRRFRHELAAGAFDVVHRLTPMSPTIPSPLASWTNVPFVLGPLNGGLKWPAAYQSELVREREWLSRFRNAYRSAPFYASTLRNARAILAAFHHTMSDIGVEAGPKLVNFPEIGIDPALFSSPRESRRSERKTILFVGRLVPLKLSQLIVEAFGETEALKTHRLLLVGDGPEREGLEATIKTRNWGDRIELCGWKSQSEVGEFMRRADILVAPSIRELGGGVVIEAMASGMACIVVDYGGPGELVNGDRGIKLPLVPHDELRGLLSEAMTDLVTDDAKTRRLGDAARAHALQFFTWEAKAAKIIEVYDWVLGQRDKPDFWSAPVSSAPALSLVG